MAAPTPRLLVGLGNPGPDYALTRHNVGFWFVDALARAQNARFKPAHQGELARVSIGASELQLFKPLTYMNRSGLAIRGVIDYFKIAVDETLVAHDELDLPLGTVRLKSGGGAGGHNGLRDTIAHLGDGFWRLRFGIAHPGNRDEVLDYVLKRAPREEEEQILESVRGALEILPVLLEQGPEKAMNRLHRKKPEQADSQKKDS